MPDSLHLGFLTFSTATLLWLVVVFAAWFVGSHVGKKSGLQLDVPLYVLLLLAVVVGRAAFVWRYWAQYAGDVWSVVDVRDGGIDVWVSLVAAAAVAVGYGWRQPTWRRALFAAVGTATVLSVLVVLGMSMNPRAEQHLPDVALHTVAGQRVNPQQLAGRVTVVNLWASWCPPCRREMPALVRFAAQHPETQVVLVNQGEDAAKVAAYLRQESLSDAPVWLDETSALGHYAQQRALPTTLFFDASGRLRAVKVGELSAATLLQQVQQLQPLQDATK